MFTIMQMRSCFRVDQRSSARMMCQAVSVVFYALSATRVNRPAKKVAMERVSLLVKRTILSMSL